ncbi:MULTISPECIES: CHAD domain-containing protein [unclassified Aureimonas]|uniref:CHAD domain-containing protein n=1 Tax=unclassified Aureimonas TaxID=2615206 RepID=UPI0006F330C9|nr:MULTISPECIES: CHAD domain-containing protein [unclassified Aureimonas]KQT66153.1 hypothetical protein ASG62_20345 [Aureimonas sp. Leaf427]KQT73398.1 hypothetical protein ASG54_17730 [Aureimonas sp. Leaf460]
MAFRIVFGTRLDAELTRIAEEQLTKAAAELSGGGDRHEAIHDVRKRFKKLRALFRLMRSGDPALLRAENARLRDAARALSAVRDRAALIESLDALEAHFGSDVATDAFRPARAELERRRDAAVEAEGDLGAKIATTLATIEECRAALSAAAFQRPLKRAPLIVAEGIHHTQRAARHALGEAATSGEAEAFHALRKHAKDHAAHLGLLLDLWPAAMRTAREAAAAIGDDLGLDHDYALLRAEMIAEPSAFGSEADRSVVLGLMDRRQGVLRAASLTSARRLFAESPKAAAARFERLARDAAKAAQGEAAGEPDEVTALPFESGLSA